MSRNFASEETPTKNVKFEAGDFFQLKLPELLDLVYDYTCVLIAKCHTPFLMLHNIFHRFFVAIPPTLRRDWGRQMGTLLKPGGYLITLVFPIDPPTDAGPPYFVRVEHYAEALGENFVKIVDKVPETSSEPHVGRERIVVWQRV